MTKTKSQRTNKLWDEHGHVTIVVCIIAPIESVAVIDVFNKNTCILMIDALIHYILMLGINYLID